MANGIAVRNGSLYVDDLALSDVASKVGTPCYVYSCTELHRNWEKFHEALEATKRPFFICYAVKANDHLAILKKLYDWGVCFDIVSQGELERLLHLKVDPISIFFSGVAKQREEIMRALEVEIGCFNVESVSELNLLSECARELNRVAPMALRVNPNVDPKTHPHISTGLSQNKFGIPIEEALKLYRRAHNDPYLKPIGLTFHIGSQITQLEPFAEALEKILPLLDALEEEGIELDHLDVGGGLGISYHGEEAPSVHSYVQQLHKILGERKLELILEPGRALVGSIGVLLMTVVHEKKTDFRDYLLVDAGMNDLCRTALYGAVHSILPVARTNQIKQTWCVAGPVCESADVFHPGVFIAAGVGDVLALMNAGAYGRVMSSRYNARPFAAEVMIEDGDWQLISERESWDRLWEREYVYHDKIY